MKVLQVTRKPIGIQETDALFLNRHLVTPLELDLMGEMNEVRKEKCMVLRKSARDIGYLLVQIHRLMSL